MKDGVKQGGQTQSSVSQEGRTSWLFGRSKDPEPAGLKRRLVSPLMMRIMAVNMIALVILVVGILFLGDYRLKLLEARGQELSVQATIIAGALGEAAGGGPESTDIDLARARQIITRLVGPTEHRARLFVPDGRMLTDSRFLAGDKRVLEEALPMDSPGLEVMGDVRELLYQALDMFTQPLNVPDEVERLGLRATDLDEVESALLGEPRVQIRRRADGLYVVNVAVPVQRFRRVLGALLLTSQTEDIEEIVRAEQLLTIQVFVAALAVTLLLSFFLGQTLVRPIRVLARAAERVRRGMGREERLPELSHQRDEIGDLSRSLSEMTRALYNQIDAVERFAADVAHELKNPITSMHSALETLERTDKPEHRARLAEILREDVRRLERLVTDVSDASRLDAELTRAELEPLDLNALLETIIDGYRAVGLDRGLSISLSLGSHEGTAIEGIEGRLGQVWRNLIDNALSFSPDGAIVGLMLSGDRQTVRLIVQDSGPGLPKGAESKIFKRFYSERPDHEAFGRHSGLGLSISRQIIEAHGGRLVASNRQDQSGKILGARFEVVLPRARSAGGRR